MTAAEREARIWDGRLAMFLGVTIRQYLATNPAPPGTATDADVRLWGENLEEAGMAKLASLEARHLRAAS